MKVLLLSLAVLCVVACNVQAQRNRFNPSFPPRSTGPTFPNPPRQPSYRFRRESPEEPQAYLPMERTLPQPFGYPESLPFDINGPRDGGPKVTHGWRFRRELPEELEAEEEFVEV